MRELIKNVLRDCSGASAAEYVLILAVVSAGIVVAALNLGAAISDALEGTGTTITTCNNRC